MAYDQIVVNGNPVATDLISTRHLQRLKMAWGAEGTATEVDSGSPLPVRVYQSVALPAGTNNIGDVDVLTLPGSLRGYEAEVDYADTLSGVVAQAIRQDTAAALAANNKTHPLSVDSLGRLREATLAARSTTDTISAKLATDKLMSDLTELTPKFAHLNAAAATANQDIVAAVTGKKIRVISFRLMGAATAGAATFRSGDTSDISETFNFDVRSGPMLGFNPVGHFETVAGEKLGVSTVGAGATCGVGIVYVEV